MAHRGDRLNGNLASTRDRNEKGCTDLDNPESKMLPDDAGQGDSTGPAVINGLDNGADRPRSIDFKAYQLEMEDKATSPSSPKSPLPVEPRVFKRRWFMLSVFCLVSMTNAAQWIQYSIIGNVVRDFYSVGYLAVDWLSMIYMLAYIPLIWPVTWLLERFEGGLKVVGVLGASLNCAGAWLRYAGATPDTFFLAFLGQAVCSVAQVFILGMPAHVAATWFGAKEVSTACALGVFGNQVRICLSVCLFIRMSVCLPFTRLFSFICCFCVSLHCLFSFSQIKNISPITVLVWFSCDLQRLACRTLGCRTLGYGAHNLHL